MSDRCFVMTPQMKAFECAMWLKDLKLGDTVTARHMTAIEHFLGDLLAKARALKPTKFEIHFDKNGQAHCLHPEIEVKITDATIGSGEK